LTIYDRQSVSRQAQLLLVEVRPARGIPPRYESEWQPVFAAQVERIEINPGSQPNRAIISFPDLRWDGDHGLRFGYRIRITTAEPESLRTCIFSGFFIRQIRSFSGGTEKGGAFEKNQILCLDHRWLLAATSPLTGIIARSPDNYNNWGTPLQEAFVDQYTSFSGRRLIFNYDGRANCDPTLVKVVLSEETDQQDEVSCYTPCFIDPDLPDAAPSYWTASLMLRYVLSPLFNRAYDYFPITDPLQLAGLDHPDWQKYLGRTSVEGLNIIQAAEYIAAQIGFSFREDYDPDGNPYLVFYKVGSATTYNRGDTVTVNDQSVTSNTILHALHTPAVGEQVSDAVSSGAKIIQQGEMADDISAANNAPIGLGSVHSFECTFNLVPAWLDSDLTPDTSGDNNENLFFTEADLQKITNKNSKDYFKYYHPRGSAFLLDVGRKWALNEIGTYTNGDTYNRGAPYDFLTVIANDYLLDPQYGYLLYGPFKRALTSPLTLGNDSLNPVDIKVEFSFDSGATFQVIPCTISSLSAEAGIYIDEPNLAELVDIAEGNISGGDLDGLQLNYWTSLCDDIVNSRSFKDGQWHTRVRVTATIQMDQRLARIANRTNRSGSPFTQSGVFDFSDQYKFQSRQSSSVFAGGGLYAWNLNQTADLDDRLASIRNANEDAAFSGRFTLERLWLGDDSDQPEFAVGDCIERITGREFYLAASFGSRTVFPEIVRIVYLPATQKQILFTRDLRYAEVLID